MERVYNLSKGSGAGKTAAIVSVTSCVTFRNMTIKNICLKLYQDYLKKYVGYDKVYIIATSDKEQKVNEFFDKDTVIFGIETPGLFNDLEIDDIFCRQHVLIFFGGVLDMSYFSICSRLAEWYLKHGDGHLYLIQDDPDFVTLNPTVYCDARISESPYYKKDKVPYKYKHDHPDVKNYVSNTYIIRKCFNRSIVAYCGSDYAQFFNKMKDVKPKTPNVITAPDKWDVFQLYNWQGVNDMLEEKLKDYEWKDRPYVAEYHGYTKNDKKRVETTIAFYDALEKPFMLIETWRKFSDGFKNSVHHDDVPYYSLFETVSKNAYATFIIANESTFSNFISPRYFDMMLSDIIPFVYGPYDANREYTDNEELKEFMYVETPEEFAEKVNKVATDESYYRHIKYLQRKSIYDNFNQYMNDNSKRIFREKLDLKD